MRSRAGSWDRKEGSHLQSLDPSRVALLESRSSTTITSAIVVGRLVPLELRRFCRFRPRVLRRRRGCRAKSPGRLPFRVCADVGGQDWQTFDRDPREREEASDSATQT